jgi:SecD/SecF fusion protein
MNIAVVGSLLFAQAEVAAGTTSSTAVETAWWQDPWIRWVALLLAVVVPTILSRLLGRRLRAADMWGRLATVLAASAVGAVLCWFGWPPRLGIDLKGGVILVYEIDQSRQAAGVKDDAIARLESLLASPEGARGSVVSDKGNRLTVRLEGSAAAQDAFVAAVKKLDINGAMLRLAGRSQQGDVSEVRYELAAPAMQVNMDKLVAAVSRRVNPGGQKEVTVRQFGLDQIEVIVPDVDPAEVELIKTKVSSAGVLEFRITADPQDRRHARAIELGSRTAGTTVIDDGRSIARWVQIDSGKIDAAEQSRLVTRTTPDQRTEALVILDDMNVTGGYLTRAASSFDPGTTRPCVDFAFNPAGAALFQVLTGQNLPNPANRLHSNLGILLDDELLSFPRINDTISSRGTITGNFQQSDVDSLVGILNAGSLPAALVQEPISEQKISPQLGADTIQSGFRAMLLATIVVLTFMLAYYRFSGFVADLAVLLNIVLVLAVMISIKAAFTLAGLAGLVLSVGMAVDANVLIYERMREEMDRGAAVRMAIRNGFQRAFSTIFDSNVTTLITAVILYVIGTDQLKGFAVTLALGLLLNLFTAVFCSRVVFDLAERNRWITRLSMARLFGQTDFKFVAWVRPAILASLAFIAAGLAAAVLRGQGLFDIDFTGGTSVQVAFKENQSLEIGAVREALVAAEGLPDVAVSSVTAADTVAGSRYKIDTSNRDADAVEQALVKVFPGRLLTYSMQFSEPASTRKGEEAGKDAAADPAALTTGAALTFPEKINLPTLRATIEAGLAAEGFAGAAFDLTEASGMTSRTRGYENWSLSTALPPEGTKKVLQRVAKQLAETPVYLSANSIGAKVAGNTKLTAVYALLASLVMIVLYVWVRFQNVAFGLAAVVALAHDVLVAVACLALSRFVAPFLGWALVDDFKISLDVVAALLTIVGFSINDTIVIFDRLRELRGKSPYVTADMIDRAVNQTLSRTILTSGTALLATLILYLFGGQGIHAFAFTMLVGILTGTYSTIYIASPIVLWLQHRFAPAADSAAVRSLPRPA